MQVRAHFGLRLRYISAVFPELSPPQSGALSLYEDLLRERAVPLGLIAESDLERLRERHIRDSFRAASLIRPGDAVLCDIGPGAGLPGVVLAITKPDLRVLLVEPKQRAVGFLELAAARLELKNVEIHDARVEDVALEADVATARAFGAIERSWEAAVRVLRPGGRLIYFAGRGLEDPEGAARRIRSPERPDAVEVAHVIADFSPLVIMTRATP